MYWPTSFCERENSSKRERISSERVSAEVPLRLTDHGIRPRPRGSFSYVCGRPHISRIIGDIDRLQLARDAYGAYASGDRSVIDALLTEDFTFFSPPDPGIDRETYFERCWPNAETIAAFEFIRLVASGDEVLVTYESTKTDGRRFRNTEVLTFRGEKICKTEVYFGWDVE